MKCIAKFILMLMMAMWLPVSAFAAAPAPACHQMAMPHQATAGMAMTGDMHDMCASHKSSDPQSPLTCHDGLMDASCAMAAAIPTDLRYHVPEMAATYHPQVQTLQVLFVPEQPYRPPLVS
jgi:hypothetical protein